jgi:acyl carrier protein
VSPDTDQLTVENLVLAAVSSQLSIGREQIDMDLPMLVLPGMESLKLLSIIAEIEDSCDVIVSDDALVEVESTRDLIVYVMKNRNRA